MGAASATSSATASATATADAQGGDEAVLSQMLCYRLRCYVELRRCVVGGLMANCCLLVRRCDGRPLLAQLTLYVMISFFSRTDLLGPAFCFSFHLC